MKLTQVPDEETPVLSRINRDEREIFDNIKQVVDECVPFAMAFDHWELDWLLKSKPISDMFGKNVITAMVSILAKSDYLNQQVERHFRNYQKLVETLPETELHETVFRDSKFKKKLGLVYLSSNLAQHLAEIQGRSTISIGVINSLNGVLPLMLRKRLPKAKITCLEFYPFYHQYLEKMGFEVKSYDQADGQFDLVVGNPPHGVQYFRKMQATLGRKSNQQTYLIPTRWLLNERSTLPNDLSELGFKESKVPDSLTYSIMTN